MATGCSTQAMMLLLCHPSSDPLLPKKKKFALGKKNPSSRIFFLPPATLASCIAEGVRSPQSKPGEKHGGGDTPMALQIWGEGPCGTPPLSHIPAGGCPAAPKHPQALGMVSAAKMGTGLLENHGGTISLGEPPLQNPLGSHSPWGTAGWGGNSGHSPFTSLPLPGNI